MPRLLTLLLLLPLSLALPAGEPEHEEEDHAPLSLNDRLHGHDRAGMDDWEPRLRAQLDALRQGGMDAESERAASAMLSLLDAARLNMAGDEELLGNCRVRSFQANALGAYQYPWFGCEIYREQGLLAFHKPTGSQRRFAWMEGWDTQRLLFLGGMYFEGEMPRGYSSEYSDAPGPDEFTRDSVAWVFRLAPQEYLVAFTPRDSGFELYELRTGR
jgi:hypothetical protein